MAEYIKREDAINLVCDACNTQFGDEPCEPNECEIRMILKGYPAADVVPRANYESMEQTVYKLTQALAELQNTTSVIVRCKDCKHYKPFDFGEEVKNWGKCDMDDDEAEYMYDKEFFCARGEK